jgi:hypothetical protein
MTTYYHRYNKKALEEGRPSFYEKYVKPYKLKNVEKHRENQLKYYHSNKKYKQFSTSMYYKIKKSPDITKDEFLEYSSKYLENREYNEEEQEKIKKLIEKLVNRFFEKEKN